MNRRVRATHPVVPADAADAAAVLPFQLAAAAADRRGRDQVALLGAAQPSPEPHQADADGVARQGDPHLLAPLAARARDADLAGVEIERVPELEVDGAGEVGGRAEPGG